MLKGGYIPSFQDLFHPSTEQVSSALEIASSLTGGSEKITKSALKFSNTYPQNFIIGGQIIRYIAFIQLTINFTLIIMAFYFKQTRPDGPNGPGGGGPGDGGPGGNPPDDGSLGNDPGNGPEKGGGRIASREDEDEREKTEKTPRTSPYEKHARMSRDLQQEKYEAEKFRRSLRDFGSEPVTRTQESPTDSDKLLTKPKLPDPITPPTSPRIGTTVEADFEDKPKR